jgi:hypothetical protein
LVAVAGALAGCAAQPDGTYEGDPLLVMQGIVQDQNHTTHNRVELVLNWWIPGALLPDGSLPPYVPPSPTPVTGSFPASFELAVVAPPPKAAIANFTTPPSDGDLMALASVVARDASTHETLGVIFDYTVMYVPTPLEHRDFLPAGTSVGYHLFHGPFCASGPPVEVDPATTPLTLILGQLTRTPC